jgi:hypothetical protein
MEKLGLKAVRIGAPGRTHPSLQHTTLNARIEKHPGYPKLYELQKSLRRNMKLKEMLDLDDDGK